MNLTGITPVTEENKVDWINWLGDTIGLLEEGNYNNYATNRVFGTDNDDIDEAQDFLKSMFLTLQQYTLTPKR